MTCCVEVRGTSAGGLTARPPCERFSATFRGLIMAAAREQIHSSAVDVDRSMAPAADQPRAV